MNRLAFSALPGMRKRKARPRNADGLRVRKEKKMFYIQ